MELQESCTIEVIEVRDALEPLQTNAKVVFCGGVGLVGIDMPKITSFDWSSFDPSVGSKRTFLFFNN